MSTPERTMPYKNPNQCLSEKYFAQKDQEALAAQNSTAKGLFNLLSEDGIDTEDLDSLEKKGTGDISVKFTPQDKGDGDISTPQELAFSILQDPPKDPPAHVVSRVASSNKRFVSKGKAYLKKWKQSPLTINQKESLLSDLLSNISNDELLSRLRSYHNSPAV